VGEVPLVVPVSYENFCRALEGRTLVGGVQYVVTETPSADAANRAMDRVREYRP